MGVIRVIKCENSEIIKNEKLKPLIKGKLSSFRGSIRLNIWEFSLKL